MASLAVAMVLLWWLLWRFLENYCSLFQVETRYDVNMTWAIDLTPQLEKASESDVDLPPLGADIGEKTT